MKKYGKMIRGSFPG